MAGCTKWLLEGSRCDNVQSGYLRVVDVRMYKVVT